MLLEPMDPNERFRSRRRQARRLRAVRRVALLAVVALTAAALALGMSFLGGGGQQPAADDADGTQSTALADATPAVEPEREPVPLPDEIRGVHVTMALASLDGKLEEYYELAREGLNTIQLDVKDENGEVAFQKPAVPLAKAVGAARTYYNPVRVAREAKERGLYLVARIVVFEDPFLSHGRTGMAIGRRGGGVWTNSAGLGWTNPYDERVWKYNVDIAVAAAEAGFDEIMFDYVRFPTDGDLASAVFPKRKKEHRSVTIGSFLEYARERLEPLGVRVSAAVFGLTATREMGIGQRPRRLAAHLDSIYPMVYPSHYGPGEYNLDDPNAVPGITVARSLRDFRRDLRGHDTHLIPWLQDFSLGREYDLEDVQAQILAARDANAKGYLLWNPSGVYTDGALRGR
ncbi:MAG TPA: putative glycoside hydrolase [Gaiellaceae bacterium]|nr:putative glycoside hydrolase [Gaiellaceae bacterium]